MTAASSHVNHRRPEAGRLHRPFRAAALVALAGALAFAAQVALAQAPTRLTKVELQPQPGNQLEVKLVLDGPAPQPVAFTIDNPARLAVDLPGTSVALDFPWQGARLFRLLDELDARVADCGGRVYIAKDARMSGGAFRRFYPRWEELERHRDPDIRSHFWQRVTR